MKKFLKIIWVIFCIILLCVYCISSLSAFIAPSSFSYISFFALAFPFVLAIFIVCIIVSFFINKWLGFILLLFIPLAYRNTINTFAIRVSKTWQQQKDSATLRIMTWNVQNFATYLRKKKSPDAFQNTTLKMLALIHNYNPDVICFQQYRNVENSKKILSVKKQLDSLGYNYAFFSNDITKHNPRNPNVRIEEGSAIYSKIPFMDSGRININNSEENENLIYTDVMMNKKPVRIFTAHLQSFAIYADTANTKTKPDENVYEITYKRRKIAGYKIREAEIKHEQEVAIIRKEISKSPQPAIYCGDLNTTAASYNYRTLKGNNLQDAFLAKGSGIGNTFYKILPTLRIDVCLADTDFQVLQCKREPQKLSDHYPVITDVEWKRN